MIAGVLILSLIGVIFLIVGWLIWKKENISLLHDYERDKVAEEDKKAFCTLSGIGVFAIGVSLLITGVVLALTDSPFSFLVFAVGFFVGLAMLIFAGAKYNR